MSSNNSTGIAETTEKLGSVSLGAPASQSEAKSTPERFCSSCGKSGTNLKKCTACKCLYYCDVACQKAHRQEHKLECKRIRKVLEKRGEEESASPLEALGDIPQREECPICMRPLPHIKKLHQYQTCCGKMICCGCECAETFATHNLNRNKAPGHTCAFCREQKVTSHEEDNKRLLARAAKNDVQAIAALGAKYKAGIGMPLDESKGLEYLLRAANLGDDDSCFAIGYSYYTGVDFVRDTAKGQAYFERAAAKGNIFAGLVLGCIEMKRGNRRAAMHHWRIAAACGGIVAAEELVTCYELGYIRHDDLEESLQARDNACNEIKSETRDAYLEFLEKTGQLNADAETDIQRSAARSFA